LRERVRRYERLTRERAVLDNQIQEVRALLAELEETLAKEEDDVTRLEHGFRSFLATLTGSKEERLAREKAEAEAVRLRLDGQRTRLEWLLSDLREVTEGLAELDGIHQRFAEALARREQELIRYGDARAKELTDIARALADADADLREHEEAHQAGVVAAQAVAQVLRCLSGARGASTWDLLGGGTLADMIEHGQLRKADQAAWHAQHALDTFSRELADIGIRAEPRLPKIDTRWFVDAFFDNIIIDAVRHQRINRTGEAVAEVARWIDSTVAAIAHRRGEIAAYREQLLTRREDVLTA
jgi:Chromosome segregation ATPases